MTVTLPDGINALTLPGHCPAVHDGQVIRDTFSGLIPFVGAYDPLPPHTREKDYLGNLELVPTGMVTK